MRALIIALLPSLLPSLLAGLLAGLLLSLPTEAATLRPLATIDAPVVRLSDLFDDAGPGGERVLGAAPAPGGRLLIEAAQLAAIARQFGVDWRPASASDRLVIDRPGRVMPRETVLAAVRTALGDVGAGQDLELDLGSFAAPMVPPRAAVNAGIEQLDWDGASGRFTALLSLTAEGMPAQRLRLAGVAQEMVAIPVPVRRLNPGTVIQADDLRIARVRAGLARGEIVRLPDQAIGQTLRRQGGAGQPLALADLSRTPVVAKGARVTMRLRMIGLALAATGQALESGGSGEHIRVLNIASRAIVEAEVTGPDEVRVIPGTQPIAAAASRSAALQQPTWSIP